MTPAHKSLLWHRLPVPTFRVTWPTPPRVPVSVVEARLEARIGEALPDRVDVAWIVDADEACVLLQVRGAMADDLEVLARLGPALEGLHLDDEAYRRMRAGG